MQNRTAKNQIFFSYRRSDGTENVELLKNSFEERSGLLAFVDVDELRSGNFQEKLRSVISDCYVFVPIVTEAYIQFAFEGGRDEDSDFCLKEYREALLSGEKIVPIFVNTAGSGRNVSYDEARTAAQALDKVDSETLKAHLETLKAYLFTQNGVWIRSFPDWDSECAEKLSEIIFDSFCTSTDVPFYKDYLTRRVKELNPLTVFGDFIDMDLTVQNSFVPVDLVRQLTGKERERQDPNLKPIVLSCGALKERIRSDGLAVIIGDAGQGKSTIAKKLFIELAEEATAFGLSRDQLFPLFYECRRLNADAFSKEDAFLAELANDAGLRPEAIRSIMRYGQPLFIFDALDEIAPGQADALLAAVNNYLRKDTGLPTILFTARPGQKHVAGTADMTVDHTEHTVVRRYTVNELTEEQRNRYISVLTDAAHSGEEKKQAFIRGIDRKEREVAGYTELSRNPFLLFAAFETFGSETDLPDTYFDAVSRMIEDVIRRDLGKEAFEYISVDEIRAVLGALAYGLYTDRDNGRLPLAGAERAVTCALELFGLDSSDRSDRAIIGEYKRYFGRSRLFDSSGFRHEFLASAYAAYYLRLLIRRKVKKGYAPTDCGALTPLKGGADYWKSVEKALLILLDRESADSKEFVEPMIDEMQAASPDYDTLCTAVEQFRHHQPRASALLLQKMLERGCRWISARHSPDDATDYPEEANPYEELFYYPAVFPYLKQYLQTLALQGGEDEASYIENELIKEVQALFSNNPQETLTEQYLIRKEARHPDLADLLEKAAGNRRDKNIKGHLRIAENGLEVGWAARIFTGLETVTIPESVREIGHMEFSNCTELTSVTIPESVWEIGDGAFFHCTGLISVTIPEGVIAIGKNAFFHCTGLECLKVAENNSAFHSEGNCIIATAKKELIVGCKNSVIPTDGSVTKISKNAFSHCTGLKSVTIPESVWWIGNGAFSYCTGLECLKVTENNSAFHSEGNCIIATAKKELIVGCKNSVIPTDGSVIKISKNAFSGCTGLKSVTIPESVWEIGDGAFFHCTGLTSMTIPEGVRVIGAYAFWGCTGLTSVTIPKGLRKIDDGAFSGCTGLTNMTIPESVVEIGYHAFSDCRGLEYLKVSKKNSVFHSEDNCVINTAKKELVVGCKNSVIPTDGSVVKIGGSAFSGCTRLTNVNFPEGICEIGLAAFRGCTGLTSVNIPEGVHEIDWNAFSGCTGLISVTIPRSIREIESYAFAECSSLSVVRFRGTEEEWRRIAVRDGNEPLLKAQIVFDFHPE